MPCSDVTHHYITVGRCVDAPSVSAPPLHPVTAEGSGLGLSAKAKGLVMALPKTPWSMRWGRALGSPPGAEGGCMGELFGTGRGALLGPEQGVEGWGSCAWRRGIF